MAKRLFDIVAAIIGLVLLAPLMAILALAVLVNSGRPVFYRARRAGRHGKPFQILKFRSMSEDPTLPRTHHSGDDDPRITGVGRFLRKTKFDELPQLWNVLIGHMSIVGPRPETLEYTKLYTEAEARILSVRPGITDYASIEFADLGTLLSGDDPDKIYREQVWDKKMALRMKYVDNQSFLGDLALIGRTIMAVVRSPKSHA